MKNIKFMSFIILLIVSLTVNISFAKNEKQPEKSNNKIKKSTQLRWSSSALLLSLD